MSPARAVGSAVTWMLVFAGIAAVAGQEPKAKTKFAPQRVPAGVKAERNLDYVGNGLVRQRLDLFVPEKAERPVPLIVWVHGGAWRVGSKDVGNRALFLASRGYAVASINYRLVDDGPFPRQIEDCRAAIRWLRAHASNYTIDPDRIGVWGGSAGGHLVALLGTSADETAWDDVGGNRGVSARVQAVCDFFGHSDFVRMLDGDRPFPADGPIFKLMGGPPREKRDVVEKASPVTFVSKDDPPFLIVHGDHDDTVPLQQSEVLYKRLKDAGVEATFLVVKNGRHGTWGPDAQPNNETINENVASFFDRHLKRDAAKPAGDTRDR